MTKVTRLGHLGVFVKDMPKMIDFYSNFLGMTVTDRSPDDGAVFLSAQPEQEHHELALLKSEERATVIGQLSFKVGSLSDLRNMYRKGVDSGLEIARQTNHGASISFYLNDPEQNNVEVYWSTGRDYPQPCIEPIDLSKSEEELMQILESMPPKEGAVPRFYGQDVGKRILTAVR
jgi:catechol-2,3-dioxygenase